MYRVPTYIYRLKYKIVNSDYIYICFIVQFTMSIDIRKYT